MEHLVWEGKVLPGLSCDLKTHFCFLSVQCAQHTGSLVGASLDCPVCCRVDMGSRPHFLCCARCGIPFVEQAVASEDGYSQGSELSHRPGLGHLPLLSLLYGPEV